MSRYWPSTIEQAVTRNNLNEVEQMLDNGLNAHALAAYMDRMSPEMMHFVLAHGVDVNGRSFSGGQTCLWQCATRGNANMVRRLLACNADPLLADSYGKNPLHMAASAGHMNVIRALMECPTVDSCDTDHMEDTALHYAAYNNEPLVIGLLLRYKANPFAENADVEQPAAKPKRELTAEEKAQKVAQLKALMEQKRIRREEEERARRRDAELRRRVEGKKNQKLEENWEETKARLEREKQKRQEAKDAEYKQQLLLKIRAERGGRQTKPVSAETDKPAAKKTKVYDSCTIQVRCKGLPNATWKGGPDAKLREVFDYLKSTGSYGSSFGLATTYPRKVYRGSELDSTSVKDAGLVPRGVMMVDK